MKIDLSLEDRLARLRADLRMGVPVVLCDAGQDWLVAAIETLSPARLAELRGFGPVQVVLTRWRAQTLAAPAYDGDLVRIAVPADAPARWFHGVADPSLDMAMPMKGPFAYVRDGSCMGARMAIRLAKKAGLLPALAMVAVDTPPEGTGRIDCSELAAAGAARSALERISGAKVPLRVSQDARVEVFRARDGGEEHYAIEIGQPSRDGPVLSRLHSACFTGDLIGSLKCDCGPQLNAALAAMGEAGQGVLLYLNQEGRGIGLANKMRAYALQDQGFDTVEANHRLGFEDDERDFRLGAEMLRMMGFSAVRLMTNNPAKVARMTENGISVAERVPLIVGHTPQNERYLAVKAKKSGHLL